MTLSSFGLRPGSSRVRAGGVAATAVVGISALVLTGCSGGSEGADDGEITVVTTTSVYADIVEQIAGDGIEVVPVIDSPAQDPHSYEATPQDRLTVEDADLVVLNGGGYDSFMEELAEEAGVPVVNAVDVSGLEEEDEHAEETAEETTEEDSEDHAGHDHGSFNEHVWYDLDSMGKLGETVAEELGELDEANAQTYTDNAATFSEQTTDLHDRVTALGLEGDYLAAEPIADYLLEDAGLHNVTPTEFTVAVEDGTDAAPLVYNDVQNLVTDGELEMLVFNEQTATGQSEDLQSVAEEAGLPVLAFTETLPEGTDYLGWMGQNIDDLESASGESGQ